MFTQQDEEKIIIEYYDNLIKNFYPFLSKKILDIGANDGLIFSNSRALILKNTDLVCYFVEPNPITNKRLRDLYQKTHHKIYDFAIGEYDGNTNLFCNGSHVTDKDNGLLSTILENETKRWGEKEKWENIEVEIKRYPFNLVNFDFISIDAEGMDECILKQIDLSKTYILCIEWNSLQESYENINTYCKSFSMDLVYRNTTNLIYYKNPF